MSVTNRTISCGMCHEAYTEAGERQPQFFKECGHGTCKTCIPTSQTQAAESTNAFCCRQCKAVVSKPAVNFDLISHTRDYSAGFDTMASATVALVAPQILRISKSLDDELAEVGNQLSVLKENIVADLASEIAFRDQIPLKAQELVYLGVFDDIEQAKFALAEKTQALKQKRAQKIESIKIPEPLNGAELDKEVSIAIDKVCNELRLLAYSRTSKRSAIDRMRKEQTSLNDEIAGANSAATNLYHKRDIARSNLDKATQGNALDQAQAEFDKADDEIALLQFRKDGAASRISRLRHEIEKQEADLQRIEGNYACLIEKHFGIIVEEGGSARCLRQMNQETIDAIAKAGTPKEDTSKDGIIKFHRLPDDLKRHFDNQAMNEIVIASHEKTISYRKMLREQVMASGTPKIVYAFPKYIINQGKALGSFTSEIASSIDHPFACGICYGSYKQTGMHEPLVFNCGHGACQGCVANMQKAATVLKCHQCRKQIDTSAPNLDIKQQMDDDAKELDERFTPYRTIIEIKEQLLFETRAKFNVLVDTMNQRSQTHSFAQLKIQQII